MELGARYVPNGAGVRALGARVGLTRLRPVAADWSIPMDGEDYGNDTRPNCWEVAQAWAIALRRTVVTGSVVRPEQAVIDAQFVRLGAPDGTDTAAATADWAARGVKVADQTMDLIHPVQVDPTVDRDLALAIGAAGPCLGIWRLPMALQDLSRWSQAPGAGPDWQTVWGDHATCLPATDGDALVWCITWGRKLEVHPEIRRRYMLNLMVPLDLAPGGWCEAASGVTPLLGLDRAALAADVASLGVPA